MPAGLSMTERLVDFEDYPGAALQRVEIARDSKHEGKLLMEALKAEAACAAYREALKNVMRSGSGERVKIAEKALFGNASQRGKTMLKLVKATVQVWWWSRHGTEKDFLASLAALDVAMGNFELKGATCRKWLKRKELRDGVD